jgi:uncharacterized oxidoreductase
MDTSNHVALVTGGGSGIGRAIAAQLTALGNAVVITGRNEERLRRTTDDLPGVRAIRCDLSDEQSVAALLRQVERDHGRLTLLVNNAGVAHHYDVENYAEAANLMQEEVDTNLLAPLRLTSLALPLLRRQPSAAIVNVSSVVAYAGTPDFPVYSATKAALHSLSRTLRARLKGTPVRVFEVLPAVVDTDMVRGLDVAKAQPETVAKALVDALRRDRYEVRVGQAKAAYLLSRLSISRAEKAVTQAMTPRSTMAGEAS